MKPTEYAEQRKKRNHGRRVEWACFAAKHSDAGPLFVAEEMAQALQDLKMGVWDRA